MSASLEERPRAAPRTEDVFLQAWLVKRKKNSTTMKKTNRRLADRLPRPAIRPKPPSFRSSRHIHTPCSLMFAVTHAHVAAAHTFRLAPRARRAASTSRRAVSVSVRASKDTGIDDIPDPTSSRRALLSGAFALAALAPLAPARASDADFVADTKELIALQRGLLREGKGDVEAYFAKAEKYFSGYKWDHQGHTNSFSALMNTDVVIREQAAYLDATGGAWTPDTVPPTGTPKAKILEGYLQNAERCVVKEGYPKFNAMDAEQRAEWKAITCTQGLVAPAD